LIGRLPHFLNDLSEETKKLQTIRQDIMNIINHPTYVLTLLNTLSIKVGF